MVDLGLQAQAAKYFGFLVENLGYRCTESTPYNVRFESLEVVVELVFDGNRSYELGLLVGQLSLERSGVPSFSIDDILRLRHAPEAERYSLVQVTSAEALSRFVEELSRMLRVYASDFIQGTSESFAEVGRLRQREIRDYAHQRDLRTARADAEEAWRAKDYARVVTALAPQRNALTRSEVLKLQFAEDQLRADARTDV